MNDNHPPPATAPAAPENVETWSGKSRADENFPVGSALIAARLRQHVHAYYAFARNADDIADSPDLAPADKIRRLDLMEDVLLGHATPASPNHASPSAAALRESLAATGADPRHATDLLVAFRQDAAKTRYANWAELLDYCRFSAMPVGRHLLDLHGESDETFPPSDAICASLQVLNHLQDIQKDLLALDRCYLPADLMARHQTGIDDIARPAATPGMRRVIDALLDECDTLNRAGRALPPQIQDRRLRLEVAVILGLAERLAARLRRQDPLARRVKLSKLDAAAALLAALRYWR
jgi:farnesyl-diphosphate farnesyltransferase